MLKTVVLFNIFCGNHDKKNSRLFDLFKRIVYSFLKNINFTGPALLDGSLCETDSLT